MKTQTILNALIASSLLALPASRAQHDGAEVADPNPARIQELVQRQLDQAQHQLELAQAAVEDAASRVPEPPEPPELPEPPDLDVFIEDSIDEALAYGLGSRSSAPPLIVGTSPLPPEKLGEIAEDLNVMARILTKAMDRPGGGSAPHIALGIAVGSPFAGRTPCGTYLEGFGVLFPLTVKYPLAAPPKAEAQKPSEEPEDTTWEETKREVFGTGGRRATAFRKSGTRETPKYDPARVEDLKKALLAALKNASNIRHLAIEDAVVVTVQGASQTPVEGPRINTGERMMRHRYGLPVPALGTTGGTRVSTLTIRVKKGDVDDLAKGRLTTDEFAKRAAIAVY